MTVPGEEGVGVSGDPHLPYSGSWSWDWSQCAVIYRSNLMLVVNVVTCGECSDLCCMKWGLTSDVRSSTDFRNKGVVLHSTIPPSHFTSSFYPFHQE